MTCCQENDLDVKTRWVKQHHYTYALFYQCRDYNRKRLIRQDEKNNHKQQKLSPFYLVIAQCFQVFTMRFLSDHTYS